MTDHDREELRIKYDILDEENYRLGRKCDRLEDENDELLDRLLSQKDAETELELAYELLGKSGIIPDTTENQWKFSERGLRWALVKYS